MDPSVCEAFKPGSRDHDDECTATSASSSATTKKKKNPDDECGGDGKESFMKEDVAGSCSSGSKKGLNATTAPDADATVSAISTSASSCSAPDVATLVNSISKELEDEEDESTLDPYSESIDIGQEWPKVTPIQEHCQHSVLSHAANTDFTSWQEEVKKHEDWPTDQCSLYGRMVDILEQGRLGKLVSVGTACVNPEKVSLREETLTTLHSVKATEAVRQMFAELEWDKSTLSWLNTAILDTLGADLLDEYINVLVRLQSKVPECMDRVGLLDGHGSRRFGAAGVLQGAIGKMVAKTGTPRKDSWKLPSNLTLVFAPGEFSWKGSFLSRWKDSLGSMGKVVTCPDSTYHTDTVIKAFQKRIKEARHRNPNKPIVLIGTSASAKAAISLSFREQIDVVVCLGLQLHGMAGNPSDAVTARDLLQMKTPVLFAVGSRSHLCPMSLMEKVRVQMQARNKLVIVRDANESLRIPLSKRLKVQLTQEMSDQLVVKEIGSFLEEIYATKPVQQKRRRVNSEPTMTAPRSLAAEVEAISSSEGDQSAHSSTINVDVPKS